MQDEFNPYEHAQNSSIQDLSTPTTPVTQDNDLLSFNDGSGGKEEGGERKHDQAEKSGTREGAVLPGGPLFQSGSKLKRSGMMMMVVVNGDDVDYNDSDDI